jgi:hypothetical protein
MVFHGHCCLFIKVLHHHRTKEVPVRCLQSVGGVWIKREKTTRRQHKAQAFLPLCCDNRIPHLHVCYSGIVRIYSELCDELFNKLEVLWS